MARPRGGESFEVTIDVGAGAELGLGRLGKGRSSIVVDGRQPGVVEVCGHLDQAVAVAGGVLVAAWVAAEAPAEPGFVGAVVSRKSAGGDVAVRGIHRPGISRLPAAVTIVALKGSLGRHGERCQ